MDFLIQRITEKEKTYKFPMTFEYTRTDYINAILEMEEQDIEYIRQTLNKRKEIMQR